MSRIFLQKCVINTLLMCHDEGRASNFICASDIKFHEICADEGVREATFITLSFKVRN